MENKINIACFKECSKTAEVKDIWQWDYGQILRIQGLSLPTAVEIHFSLDEHGGEAARRIGVTKDGVTDVPIPDSMVENESAYGDSYYFFAYIYLTDETSGNTEYKIRAKVSTRSKPEGYVSSGNDTFAEILKTVNEIAEDKVDVPESAKVGQVLAVKETDESGKPTEFEAKDMSGGVSAGTGLSTEAIDKLEEVGNYLAYTTADGGSKWTELISILRNGSSGGGSSETVPATGITLDKTTLSFTDSATQTLVATVEPSDTTDKIVWTSNAESVAKVTNGVVKPLSNGSATITATCGSVSATCSVTVDIAEEEQVTLTSISATYTGGDVAVGTSLNDLTGITVTATYSDGSTATATGYTLNGEIAEGENTITVSYGGKTTTFTVTGVAENTVTVLYELEEPTTLTGTTAIDTNVALFDKDKTWSMAIEFVPASLAGVCKLFCLNYDADNYMQFMTYYGNKNIKSDAKFGGNWGATVSVPTEVGAETKLVVMYDGTTIDCYYMKNGSVTKAPWKGAANNMVTNNTTLVIGRETSGFQGTVNAFTIYEGVLNAEEINSFLGV